MTQKNIPPLKVATSPGAKVIWADGKPAEPGGIVHLEIPPGPADPYRLAQLDDYHQLPRHAFPWSPPLTISLCARASDKNISGTWGFGLWNDPFSFSLGLGGAAQRLPALPNATWFFYASPPNFLSFRDDQPAQGFLAATFRSAAIPAPLLAIAAPGLGAGLWPPTARLLRRVLRAFIKQDAVRLTHNVTEWHSYELHWQAEKVTFGVDDGIVCTTSVSPRGPLALVIWIDNQYAALPPTGKLTFGRLPLDQTAWLEIDQLEITPVCPGFTP